MGCRRRRGHATIRSSSLTFAVTASSSSRVHPVLRPLVLLLLLMMMLLLHHSASRGRGGAVTAFAVLVDRSGGRVRRRSSSIHWEANTRTTLSRGSTIPRTSTVSTTATTTTTSTTLSLGRPLASSSAVTCTSHPNDTLDGESVVADTVAAIDYEYMAEAIQYATRGLGHTFPNPAVGCLLVRTTTTTTTPTDIIDDTNTIATTVDRVIVGRGFHPRAGFPHAEVFALLEAAGHVESGLDAAQAIVEFYNKSKPKHDDTEDVNDAQQPSLVTKVQQLSDQYSSPGGPEALFADCLRVPPTTLSNTADVTTTTTAYVTLEPCCHYGRTPPCAVALQLAKVDRVVVGYRDPNPRVDGGGVQLLQAAGIAVQMLNGVVEEDNNHSNDAAVVVPQRCAALVTNFVKRITPRTSTMNNDTGVAEHWQDALIGKHRMALRAHANRLQGLGQLEIRSWNSHQGPSVTVDETMADTITALPLPPEWMEQVDDALWKSELVLLRLSKAVAKRKGVKLLGTRIAEQLQAHVAQSKGHAVLLYRPGMPPLLDLEQMIVDYRKGGSQEKESNDDDNDP